MQFLTSLVTVVSLSTAVLAAPTPAPKRDISQDLPAYAAGLPAPPSDLKLKSIILGVGTQNYTCADGLASTKPVAIGAVADLYDMSSVVNDPFADLKIQNTPPLALGAFIMGGHAALQAVLNVAGYGHRVGKHYFDAAGTPTFDLVSMADKPMVKAKRVAGIAAPPSAWAGVPANGAVDWLYLGDNGASRGYKGVYRVITAGGKASATCEGQQGEQTVRYATEYWMYG